LQRIQGTRRKVTFQIPAVLQLDGADTILNKKTGTQSVVCPSPKFALPSVAPGPLGLATKRRYAPFNRIKQKADVIYAKVLNVSYLHLFEQGLPAAN
jgi:hypothetical protein